MRKLIPVLLVISAVCFMSGANASPAGRSQEKLAAETPIPPSPTKFVTDTAGFLSASTVDTLSRSLGQYQRDSGHQILVYIGQTTGEAPIDDWAVRAFKQWKIGRAGLDDGLALFIMAQDRRLRIEVGYGLEGEVPDALAGRIINEIIVPRIQSGDRDGAVTAGVQAIVSAISGQGLPAAPAQGRRNVRQNRPLTLGQMILYGIIGLVVLVVLATHPSMAVWLLMSMMSGGGRRRGGWGDGGSGGGWGGGGGFSGGGGSSGGGGASGSW